MEKEYGKLTPAQFRGFVDQLPAFRSKAEDLRKFMQDTPSETWDKILTEDYSWAWVYEFPLVLHLAVAVYALNLTEWINEVAASDDPQQRVLDDLHREISDEFHPDVQAQHGLGLVVSVIRTMQSILLFGRSLSALIQEVRDNNDLDCLFKAIKVDRKGERRRAGKESLWPEKKESTGGPIPVSGGFVQRSPTAREYAKALGLKSERTPKRI